MELKEITILKFALKCHESLKIFVVVLGRDMYSYKSPYKRNCWFKKKLEVAIKVNFQVVFTKEDLRPKIIVNFFLWKINQINKSKKSTFYRVSQKLMDLYCFFQKNKKTKKKKKKQKCRLLFRKKL